MPDSKRLYAERLTTPETAVSVVQSGMRVYHSGNCSVPRVLNKALAARAPMLNNVEIVQMLNVGGTEYAAPEMEGHFRINALFIGSEVRLAVNECRADMTPIFLSEASQLFSTTLPIDVAIIQVSPPDDHGYCSFGVEVGVSKTAAEQARIIIAEINPNMPRTHGDSFIHVSKLTHIVEVYYPIPEFERRAPSPLQQQIGQYIADLIEDGSTLQTGIGELPDAVLSCLGDKQHLGIHSELFSDGVIDLIEAGVITNERKTLHPGKLIAGFVLGSKRLYDFIHDNPMVELHPTEYVNDPFRIAQNRQMVAINAALEVDLSGQVCADSIGHRLYSGVGGQVDFVRGAARSAGGKP
ncbi:MAG TPA: acetyl-CoA hydrolase/transferase C-terminal domain-containing protein, partial [Aggregatilineales bacterium]|nr:acetyl-CoA hydrolase/transferase C-terminal domain-containing protein [Aggregatilineales bacterium]